MNELWDEIPEQEKPKNILNKLIQSRRVPHAFLFYGEEGIGKYFTALQLIKIMNIKGNDNNSAKNNILNKISSLQEPYIKLIFPLPRGKGESGDDTATEKLSKETLENIQAQIQKKVSNPYHKIQIEEASTIKINSIREIKKFVNINYDDIPYRFIVILNAHLMNEQAQNALLKNLEEPPEGIIFILITNEKNKLLSTILSRCWQVNFEPLSDKTVSELLIKYYSVEEKLSEKLAKFSEGSINNAINLLVQSDFNDVLDLTVKILRYSLGKKYNMAYKELTDNNNSVLLVIQLIKIWLNDVLRNRYDISNYMFKEHIDTLEKFNLKFNHVEVKSLVNSLEIIENFRLRNLNLNIVYLCLIFDIAALSIRK